jgi:hypothetical protein
LRANLCRAAGFFARGSSIESRFHVAPIKRITDPEMLEVVRRWYLRQYREYLERRRRAS